MTNDTWGWRERGLAAAAIAVVLLAGYLLTASANQQQHAVYLPLITNGDPPKRGLAFSSHQEAAERVALLGDTVHYWRGWQVGNSLPGDQWGLEFTPSVWCDFYWHGKYNQLLRPQMQVLDLLGADYDGYLLFLNEPDLSYYGYRGQCEITPFRAAQIYVHIKSFMPKAQLVGPGISHVDYLNGFRWLGEWFDFVVHYTGSPPDIHAWDIHTYLRTGPPLAPYDALEAWLATRGVRDPIFWITEYGACDPYRLRHMIDSFEADSRIERYYLYEQTYAFWDGDGRCILLFEEGSEPIHLTQLGWTFVTGHVMDAERLPQ